MSFQENTSPDVWIQSRRRIDAMMGVSCLAVCAVAMWISWPAVWRSLAFLPILGVQWHLLRRSIPREGKVYERLRISYEHKVIVIVACLGLPWILLTLAVDWLSLPHAAWWYAGLFVIFFGLLIGSLDRMERSYRRSLRPRG